MINTTDKTKPLRAKFIQACVNLDVRIIEHYLEEEDVIMGLEKYKFLAYLQELFTEADRKEIEKGLLKYCELDTLAMVMLYEHFLELLRS